MSTYGIHQIVGLEDRGCEDRNDILAASNAYNGVTLNIDSRIYKWVDTSFVDSQSIPTSQASPTGQLGFYV
jgi:hypothetical protein